MAWGGGGGSKAKEKKGRAKPRRTEGPGSEASKQAAGQGSAAIESGTGTQSAQDRGEAAYAVVDRAEVKQNDDTGVTDEGPYRELGGREKWEQFLSQVREAKLPLGIWIFSSEVKGVKGDRLVLGFSPQHRFAMEMVLEEKNKRFIETHLEKFFGRKLIIETDESKTGAGAAEPPKRKRPGGDKVDLSGEDAVLEEIVKEFDGEVFSKE